jgi:thioesterase domain-containing protein
MATENIRYIRLRQPTGPYLLAGYSGGAWTAFEMARQLRAMGETVAELILLDIVAPNLANRADPVSAPIKISPIERLKDEMRLLNEYGPRSLYKRFSAKFINFVLRGKVIDLVAITSPTFARSRRSAQAWFAAARKYNGGAYDGSVSLVMTTPVGVRAEQFLAKAPYLGWDELVPKAKITCTQMDGGHLDMVRAEYAEILAQFIEGRINAGSLAA